MIRLSIVLFVLHISFYLSAQDNFNDYSLLQSSSIIPDDFIENFEETYVSQKSRLSDKQLELLGENKTQFLIYNSYVINEILKSGIVTFNDPISNYSSKVLDKLLENDKNLRSKIRIYTIKSTQANAFSTSDGIIFISIGLIAQLQNEAQLAYVLAHELVHYTENHHILEYLQKKDAIESYELDKNNESKLLSFFSYSKENELVADSKALDKYYLNTDYSISEIESLFDILLYSYLPIDEVEFDLSFFESDTYQFPEDYRLTEYNEITAIENYDDTNLTHPNILKRRSALMTLLAGYNDTGSQKFLVSEKEFFNIRKISRYELSALYRIYNEPENAIYNSYILLKEDPNNKFLKTNVAECLYLISCYKNKAKPLSDDNSKDMTEGYIQQINYLFSKMDRDEIELLTLRYSWLLKSDYPNDPYINQMTDSIIKENSKHLSISLNDLQVDTFKILDSIQYQNLNKTEKIKYNKKLNSLKEFKYYYNALNGLPNTSEIIKKYHAFINENNDPNSYIENNNSKEKIKIDKIILLSPYYSINSKYLSEEGMNNFSEEKKEFIDIFIKSADKLNIKLEKYDISEIDKNDVERFNEHALFSLWRYEINNTYQGILSGTEKYMKTIKHTENSYYANIGLGQMDNVYFYFLFLFDANSGKLIYSYNENIKKVKRDYLTSQIYKSLFDISSLK
jgi:hypothetical protein